MSFSRMDFFFPTNSLPINVCDFIIYRDKGKQNEWSSCFYYDYFMEADIHSGFLFKWIL